MCWSRTKRAFGSTNILVAISSAPFGIDTAIGWLADIPNGLSLSIGKLLSGFAMMASGTTQYVTRYNGMVRNAETDDKDPNRSFCDPGVKTTPLGRISYSVIQTAALLNSAHVFTSGCLGAFTVARFTAGGANYICSLANTTCSEEVDDALWKLALLNSLALFFGVARVLSHTVYNRRRIANHYAPSLVEEDGKHSKSYYTLALLNAGVCGTLAFVSNQRVINHINNYTLKHISSSFHISPLGATIYSAVGVATSVITYFVMTVPTLDRINVSLPDYSKELPRWYKMRGGIYLALGYNSLAWGLNSAACIALTVSHWTRINPLNYYLVGCSLLFGGVLGTATTIGSDLDAFREETEVQMKLFAPNNPGTVLDITDKKTEMRAPLLGDGSINSQGTSQVSVTQGSSSLYAKANPRRSTSLSKLEPKIVIVTSRFS